MNAREIALQIINDVHTNEAYANVSLAREIKKQPLTEQDRRFITELTYGTVKAGETLDWILGRYSNRPLKKIAPIVQDILRLGLYQIFFMDKVPVSAACNQAVELVKKYGHPGTVKFVNAVLRSAARNPEQAAYPEGESNESKRLALEYFHPEWLVKRWSQSYGVDETKKICAFNNRNASLSIRTNTIKIDREALFEILRAEGVEFSPSAWTPEGIVCTAHPALNSLVSLRDGLFQVQDESSMLVAHILNPQPGERILDACSAPGGKTTHIAALMENRGEILAVDLYEHKLQRIGENAARLGIHIIRTELADAAHIGERYPDYADRVLVDAPCSGLGVLRRKPDARWKKELRRMEELPALQLAILNSAADAVKPGGILVYSTCTMEQAENQHIVESFLAVRQDFSLDSAADYLPYHNTTGDMIQLFPHIDQIDGFFIARMKRGKR